MIRCWLFIIHLLRWLPLIIDFIHFFRSSHSSFIFHTSHSSIIALFLCFCPSLLPIALIHPSPALPIVPPLPIVHLPLHSFFWGRIWRRQRLFRTVCAAVAFVFYCLAAWCCCECGSCVVVRFAITWRSFAVFVQPVWNLILIPKNETRKQGVRLESFLLKFESRLFPELL